MYLALSYDHRIIDGKDSVGFLVMVKEALENKDLGILVIHDKDWNKLEASFRKKLSNSVKPTVIAIGSEVDEGLRDRIKTAIGVDLLN